MASEVYETPEGIVTSDPGESAEMWAAEARSAMLRKQNARAEAAEARKAELREALSDLCDAQKVAQRLDYFDPGEEWAAGYHEAMSRVRRALAGEKGGA